jgi:molybdate-binding protein/DNA-binding XRE family transcriptional regulator
MGTLRNCVGRKRSAAGIRQQDLAVRAGISRQSLSLLESGRSVPSAALALRLARALGCRVEELFWAEDAPASVDAELAEADRGGGRAALAFIDGRWVAHRLDPGSAAGVVTAADGILSGRAAATGHNARVRLLGDEAGARQTLLCAGCAPAFGILASRASRSPGGERVVWLERSSTAALDLLSRGQIHVAGAHLYDDETREFNVPFVKRRLPGRAMLIFNLARWEAGLVVAPGNPRGIRGVGDLARPGMAFARRQDGAAAQDLVERLLRREGLPRSALPRHGLTAAGHGEAARLVALGAADAALTLEAVARAHGLPFIPVAEERFDLVIARELAGDPRVVRLLDTLGSGSFRREMQSLGGHLVRDAGKLIAETGIKERTT